MKVGFKIESYSGRMHHELSFDMLEELKRNVRSIVYEKVRSTFLQTRIFDPWCCDDTDKLMQTAGANLDMQIDRIVDDVLRLEPDEKYEYQLKADKYTLALVVDWTELVFCIEPISEKAIQEIRSVPELGTLCLQDPQNMMSIQTHMIMKDGKPVPAIVSTCCQMVVDRFLGHRNSRRRLMR